MFSNTAVWLPAKRAGVAVISAPYTPYSAFKRYIPAPAPLVVGRGLDQIPAAMVAQKNGVSATKLLVTL